MQGLGDVSYARTGDISYSETGDIVLYAWTGECVIYREWIGSHIQGLGSLSFTAIWGSIICSVKGCVIYRDWSVLFGLQ